MRRDTNIYIVCRLPNLLINRMILNIRTYKTCPDRLPGSFKMSEIHFARQAGGDAGFAPEGDASRVEHIGEPGQQDAWEYSTRRHNQQSDIELAVSIFCRTSSHPP